MVYSFGGSCIILFLINLVPGLHLRSSEDDEILGIDDAEMGEFAYDYVELSRDFVCGEGDAAAAATAPTGTVSHYGEEEAFARQMQMNEYEMQRRSGGSDVAQGLRAPEKVEVTGTEV